MQKLHTLLSKFTGLDQGSTGGEQTVFSPDMLNFRITDKFELKKRDGFTAVTQSLYAIRAIWSGVIKGFEQIIYVSNGVVYTIFEPDYTPFVIGTIEDCPTLLFAFDNVLYIFNTENIYKYDGTGLSLVEGYIPTVAISCPPSGGGTPFEVPNMICDKRKQLFSATANETVYKLAEDNITAVTEVTVDNVVKTNYTVNKELGQITFASPPPSGTNNVSITYQKSNDQRKLIASAKHAMLFGDSTNTRVFLWGIQGKESFVYRSELVNGLASAEYFPELNFNSVGNSEITDIVQQYDRQLIFTRDSAYYSYCDVRYDSLGTLHSSFPIFPLNGSKGNLISGTSCTINGNAVTVCRDGINVWHSTNIANEKQAVCISKPVYKGLQGRLHNCTLFDFQSQSELYVATSSLLYVYNYKLNVWYVYDGIIAERFCEYNGKLFILAIDRKIYTFSPDVNDHGAYWTSGVIDCKQPFFKKDFLDAVISLKVEAPDAEFSFSCKNSESVSEDGAHRTFNFDYNQTPYNITRKVRLAVKRANSVEIKIVCDPKKSLTLRSIGLISLKKGDINYGI